MKRPQMVALLLALGADPLGLEGTLLRRRVAITVRFGVAEVVVRP